MDAINLLPVKPMDARPPRARADTASDQAEPGFSFENLLDERNPPAPQHPSMEAGEQGTEVPVETPKRRAGEIGADVSTLVAVFSTLPPPLAMAIPDEMMATGFSEDSLLGDEEAVTPAPSDSAESVVLTPVDAGTPGPNGQVTAPPATPNRREHSVVDHKVQRPIAPEETKRPVAAGPDGQPTPEVAPADASESVVPNQDPMVAPREVPAISHAEPILNSATLPVESAAAVPTSPALPVASAEVAFTTSQPARVTAPATRRTAVHAEGFSSTMSSVEQSKVGRAAGTPVVGIVEVSPDGEPFTREVPEIDSAPARIEGESSTRGVPLREDRPRPTTRAAEPRAADAVVADLPERVDIKVIDPERGAVQKSTSAFTPTAERAALVFQEQTQGPRYDGAVVERTSPVLTPSNGPAVERKAPTVAPFDGAVVERNFPPAPRTASSGVERIWPPAPRSDRTAPGAVANPVTISADGTSAATQERVMPDSFQPRVPEPKTAGPAANFNVTEPTAPTIGARTDGNSSFQNRSDSDPRQEEKSAFQQQPTGVAAPAPTFGESLITPARAIAEPAIITRADVETIVHRTAEATEHLRVTGTERLEIQIRLDAGQELTVRLHYTNGEVKPVFLTESQDLRRAIEQNWAQFSERTSDRSTRVTTPIFESPSSQSGMNDLNQRQREGREHTFNQAQAEAFAAANTPGRGAPRRPTVAGPTITAPAGLQLYA